MIPTNSKQLLYFYGIPVVMNFIMTGTKINWSFEYLPEDLKNADIDITVQQFEDIINKELTETMKLFIDTEPKSFTEEIKSEYAKNNHSKLHKK